VEQVGGAPVKTMSLEDHNQQILQEFERLGNHTVLEERNVHEGNITDIDDVPKSCEASETLSRDALTEIDLEEGASDVDGTIVLTRNIRNGQSNQLTASRCCAICLDSYSVGDPVIWSMNEKCHHVYHQSCIANHFAHSKEKGEVQLLCPTCRQDFLVLEANSSRK